MVRQVDTREASGVPQQPHRRRRRGWWRMILPIGREDVRNPGTYHTNGSGDDARDSYNGDGARDDV